LSVVQSDFGTLAILLAIGATPLLLIFLFWKPRPYIPRKNKELPASHEALFEIEAYTLEDYPNETIPGDEPFTWWQWILHALAAIAGSIIVSLCIVLLLKLYFFTTTS